MNTDLIKKLDDQSWKYLADYYNYDEGGFGKRKREKFAELIIKECCNEIHSVDVKDLRGKEYYLDIVSEHIEKHFGLTDD